MRHRVLIALPCALAWEGTAAAQPNAAPLTTIVKSRATTSDTPPPAAE